MDIFLKIMKVLFGLLGGLLGGIFGLLAGGGGHQGPRPALPSERLPEGFRGFWKGTVSDNSPNTYGRGYGVTLDFVNWRSTTAPTGPGHGGATGRLRLVAVHHDSVEVEEDVTSGASIEYSVDGVYTLRPSGAGELQVQWRSQYPSRDIYVGRGRLTRVDALPRG